jgi:hypothetical protein
MISKTNDYPFAKINRVKHMNPPSDWDDIPIAARKESYIIKNQQRR